MTKPKKAAVTKPAAPSLDDGQHIDIVMINALLHSLYTIFSTMVRLEIHPGIPSIKQDNIAHGIATGLIAMNSEGLKGSVALSLSLPAIGQISLSMLGEEFTSLNKDATDLVGELTNMLVGGAKRILSEKGHDFDMHTPQLLMGDDHEVVHYCHGQTILLPVQIKDDEFYIEMNFV